MSVQILNNAIPKLSFRNIINSNFQYLSNAINNIPPLSGFVSLTSKATVPEALNGTDDSKWMTPYLTRMSLSNYLLRGDVSGGGSSYFERSVGDATSINIGYGNMAHQIVLANDSRLSNNRTPLSHTHTVTAIDSFRASQSQAEDGMSNDVWMSPLRTKQALSLRGVEQYTLNQTQTPTGIGAGIQLYRSGNIGNPVYLSNVVYEMNGSTPVRFDTILANKSNNTDLISLSSDVKIFKTKVESEINPVIISEQYTSPSSVTYNLSAYRNVILNPKFPGPRIDFTVILPKADDGAQEGDEVLVYIDSNSSSTVYVRRHVWQGSAYSTESSQIATLSNRQSSRFIFRGNQWSLIPNYLTSDDVGAIPRSYNDYSFVIPKGSAIDNGKNLIDTYNSAKLTFKKYLYIMPGEYDLEDKSLLLDSFTIKNIIGFTNNPNDVVIKSTINSANSGTLVQFHDSMNISNITIERNTTNPSGSDFERSAAYFPLQKTYDIISWTGDGSTVTLNFNSAASSQISIDLYIRIKNSGNSNLDGVHRIKTRTVQGGPPSILVVTIDSNVNGSGTVGEATAIFTNTTIENCVFNGHDDSSMRHNVEYSGTYKKCKAGNKAFGAFAMASGIFEDCTAGEWSFGGGTSTNSIASGKFKNCTAQESSFGFDTASGEFEDCHVTSGGFSFGSKNASGKFIRCESGMISFGGGSGGVATGVFEDCVSRNGANTYNGTFTGIMKKCRFACQASFPANASPLKVGNGAKIFDSTFVALGTGSGINANEEVTISLAGCRLNKNIHSNITNNLGTLSESFNLVNANID